MARGGKSGVLILANALNIQRNEIGGLSSSIPAPLLYPIVDTKPLPTVITSDCNYMVESKQEFLRRMRDSPFFLKEKAPKSDVVRYSDKYKRRVVEPWTPHWKRVPNVLWPRGMMSSSGKPVKRQKTEGKITSKLEALEKNEILAKDETAAPEKKKGDADDEEAEKNDEDQDLSDEDYLEEGNDYIESYFDNGEDYGGGDDSDDNMDKEAVY